MKSPNALIRKFIPAFRNLLKQVVRKQKDNHAIISRPSYSLLGSLVLLVLSVFNQSVRAQTFTQGNIAVFVAAASASNTTGSIVEINTTSAGQSATNTYSINGTGASALRFSGSASSTGYLANSDDGSLLAFMGVNNTNTSANANTLNPRGVGTLNSAYTFNLPTTYTGTSGNQTRCATTINNTNWYLGDQGGLYTNGTSTASPSANLRGVKSFGGIVYGGQASSTSTVIQVSTLSALSVGTVTGLTGLTNNAAMQDFYLISSGSNGSAFDILYVVSATSNTAGTITKYSLISGTWTGNGSYTTTFGGFGLAAQVQGGGAYLFVSTGLGALTANSVIRLTDGAGYNAALNITTGNNVTLYTSATGTIIKGVAFAPYSACTPPAITSTTSNSPICANTTLNLNVAATGTATLTYAWSGPNGFTSASQNPSIANATTAASGTYSVTVTNGCGSTTGTTAVTVNGLPTATITPDVATTFCGGGSVTLSAASASSYLWSTTATTQDIVVTTSGNYAVTITDANGCSAASAATTVTVNPVVTPSVSIAAVPGTTICSGTNVTFTATPVNGGTNPSYQWTLNGNNVGTDSDTYANNALADDDSVTCILTSNAACATTSTATSNTLTISVSTSITPSLSIAADTSLSVCAGTDIAFTATPTNGGATPSYQWKLNGNNVGTNSNTYSNNSLADQDSVSCVLTSSNPCASPTTANSNSLTFTVTNSVTPSVTITAAPNDTICAGTSVTFTAVAVNGGTPVYQWTKNGNNVGIDNNTYTDVSLANNDSIACTITSSVFCVTTSTASSNVIIMTVNPVPTPTITGTLTFCTSASTILDAGAGYTSYLWSNAETTPTITVATTGNYAVTVSNGNCSGSSPSVSVTEISTPSQPAAFTASSANVINGQNGVVYTVPNVVGLTYAWNYTGTGATINGTGNSVTVNFSLSATSGTLSVTATNPCGTSASRDIAISVTALPDMRITEYMYNGLGAGGAGEFVEFTNVGSTAIDMTGWSFDDNSRVAGSQSLTNFGIVQPGESVILTESNAGTYRTNWNLCAGIKIIGNSINNLGREDEINLYDASNNLVDRITYGDQTFSPGSIRTTAKSGWVTAAGLGANNILLWNLSAVADAETSFTSALAEIGNPGKSNRATVVFDPCFVVNGAPTIVLNVSATTNYLDGGVLVSPPTPYGLSGALNDITDPAKTLGIDFTINDDVTPLANLTVTVVSGNLTVVPAANLTLTGTNGSRNLKITPAAIGYSNITVTVNDGTSSSSYILNYAASDPAPQFISDSTVWHTGMSDGSDAVALDNSFYISGDDELNVLNVYSRSHSGLPFKSYNYTANLNLPNPSSPEVDVEAGTRSPVNSTRIYWTGSYSNGKLPYDNKPNRDRMFATTVTGTGAATTFSFDGYVNFRTDLLAWGDANGYAFTASAAAGVNSKGFGGFSLEGIVFGPDNTTMYLGLRAPLVPTTLRQNAVIAPILNFEAWFNNGSPAGPPTFGAPIELNLDFRGIRDIIRLTNGTYIIVAGSPVDDGGVNNIYKWSGYATDAPVTIANTVGSLLNIEGLMQINNGAGQPDLTKLQMIIDGGAQNLYGDLNEAKDFADLNLRKFRSDIVSGMDLNICSGFAATVTPDGDTAICAGQPVTLNATTGANYTYLWNNGVTNASIAALDYQNFTVTITSATSNCSATSAAVSVTHALPSDFNGDNQTNTVDFLLFLGNFNQSCSGCEYDMNHNGVINTVDFLIFLGQFNATCN